MVMRNFERKNFGKFCDHLDMIHGAEGNGTKKAAFFSYYIRALSGNG
jgi:hypothetical protein